MSWPSDFRQRVDQALESPTSRWCLDCPRASRRFRRRVGVLSEERRKKAFDVSLSRSRFCVPPLNHCVSFEDAQRFSWTSGIGQESFGNLT